MNREIILEYNPDLIKLAVRQFWTRSVGLSGFLAFGFIVAWVLYLLLVGDRTWQLGLNLALASIALFVGVFSYKFFLHRSMSKFEKMQRPTAKLQLTDELICIESDIGRSELSWRLIEKVWQYPTVWLVFISKQGYVTLPTERMDEEVKKFILEKVAANTRVKPGKD